MFDSSVDVSNVHLSTHERQIRESSKMKFLGIRREMGKFHQNENGLERDIEDVARIDIDKDMNYFTH